MTVGITGASGFVGSRLLAGLLRQSAEPLIALTRDAPERARERLAVAVAAVGGDPGAVRERVQAVRVDLAAPRLGLPDEEFRSLAGAITTLWHCAASTDLSAPLASLAPANVDGVRHLLELAEAADHRTRFVHVSTAYVAGLRDGLAAEDDLDGSAGFASPYEESKFRAEVLVREWTRRTGRDAVVLRPSVLVTDRPLPPGAPGHTFATFAAKIAKAATRRIPGLPSPDRPWTLRIPAAPDATLNLLQVDHAEEAMLAVVRSGRTGTFHITHPVDTPVRTFLDAVEELVPGLRIDMGADGPGATVAERFVGRAFGPFLAYRNGRRSYDRSRLLAAVPRLADPAPIGRDYLRDALRAPGRPSATDDRSLRVRHVRQPR